MFMDLQSDHGDATYDLGTESDTGTETGAVTDLDREGIQDDQDNGSGDGDRCDLIHLKLGATHEVGGRTDGDTLNQVLHEQVKDFHSVHFEIIVSSIFLPSIFYFYFDFYFK